MDSSQKKKTAAAPTQSVNYLETVLNNLPVALFGKDSQNDFQFCVWNQKAEEFWGLKKEQVIGKTDYDFFPKEQSDFFRKKDEQTLAEGKTITILEEPITLPSGDTKVLQTTKVPVDGRYLIGISEDVTSRRATEKKLLEKNNELEKSQHFLNSVLDSLPQLVSFVDREYIFRYVNPACEKWLQMPKNNILGKTLQEVLGQKIFAVVDPYIRIALNGDNFSFEEALPFKEGPDRIIHADLIPYKQADGIVVGFISVTREVASSSSKTTKKAA
jgi:two-component system sensor histidine kinase/response regulator